MRAIAVKPNGPYSAAPAGAPSANAAYMAVPIQAITRRPGLRVRVEGQLVLNSTRQMLSAALADLGVAYVPEDLAEPYCKSGALKRVLEDWCPPYWGYHLYYPSRRQPSAAFSLLVEALRYRK